VRVHCGRCEEFLGEIGPSQLGTKGRQPVWRIRPGWTFQQGILVQDDHTYRAERQMLHEMGRQRMVEGLALSREVDLPICVRCPKCHSRRWVTADLVFRRVS
jgi:hypothetical protein